MFTSFHEIEDYIVRGGFKKVVALAGAQNEDALESVITAVRKGVIRAVLIGDTAKIRKLLQKNGEAETDYELIEEPDPKAAAMKAAQLVYEGTADIPMKGNSATADFMRAILHKEFGFIPNGGTLSQATVFEYPDEKRLMIASDCAVNIAPDYEGKKKITRNAVRLAHQLGMEQPKVAVLTPLEKVNPKIQATVDADRLAKEAAGEIPGCIVDGPFALDNAIDELAAKAKGVSGPVAGHADVLIMPDLCTGNVFTKSIHYFAHLKQTGSITGSRIPVIMTSRTDTPEDKYYSILISILQSLQ